MKETYGLNYVTKYTYEKDQELEPGSSDLQFNFLFIMMYYLPLRNWVNKNYGSRGGEDHWELNYIGGHFFLNIKVLELGLEYEAQVVNGRLINTFY